MGEPSKAMLLLETIRVVREENLIEKAKETGKILYDGLRDLSVCVVK